MGGDRAALGSVPRWWLGGYFAQFARDLRIGCAGVFFSAPILPSSRPSRARLVPGLGISEWSLSLSVWKCNACACGRKERLFQFTRARMTAVVISRRRDSRKVEWIRAGKGSFVPLVVESNKWAHRKVSRHRGELSNLRRPSDGKFRGTRSYFTQRCIHVVRIVIATEHVRVALVVRETTSWSAVISRVRDTGNQPSDFGRRARRNRCRANELIAAERTNFACADGAGDAWRRPRGSSMETKWMRRSLRESRRMEKAEARIDALQPKYRPEIRDSRRRVSETRRNDEVSISYFGFRSLSITGRSTRHATAWRELHSGVRRYRARESESEFSFSFSRLRRFIRFVWVPLSMVAFVQCYQGILMDHGRCHEGKTRGQRDVTTPLRCRPLINPERPDRRPSGARI